MPEEKSKIISIDQMRELKKWYYNSCAFKYKFYVIYEADKINLNAANACLKLLEDEKKDKFGILLSKNLQNMPKTLVVLLTLRPYKGQAHPLWQ